LTQVHQEKQDTCTAKLAFLIGETVPKIIRTANYSCRLYRGVVASKYRMQERWRLHSAFPSKSECLTEDTCNPLVYYIHFKLEEIFNSNSSVSRSFKCLYFLNYNIKCEHNFICTKSLIGCDSNKNWQSFN